MKEGPYSRKPGQPETTQQSPRETIVGFAVEYNGEIFTGDMKAGHLAPYKRLEAKYPDYDKAKLRQGYTISGGKFVTREEWKRIESGETRSGSPLPPVDDYYSE